MDKQKLDFSLPQSKPRKSASSTILLILVFILVAVSIFNLYILFSGQRPAAASLKGGISAEQAEQLATKLAQRNLYGQAANVWQEYLNSAQLKESELAKGLFNTAVLLEKAENYGDAIEYYYRSELAGNVPELESAINQGIANCFEKLGSFSALRYEMMERTSFNKAEKPDEKVVAEIGPEKITAADLDALIENTIDDQLLPVSQFMSPEQLTEQKKKLLEQYRNPQAKQQFLSHWLMQEALYRQALKEGLGDKPDTKRLLNNVDRDLLSQQMMNEQLAEKIHITETDLKTYYEANKNKYVEDVNDPNAPGKRQKSFDEVRQQVAMELLGEKRRDIQQQYIEEMMDKYKIIIHTSAFGAVKQNQDE
jgi:hypothetical protein